MWLSTRSREGLAQHKHTAVAGRGGVHKLLAGCEAAQRPWRPPGRDRGDPGAGAARSRGCSAPWLQAVPQPAAAGGGQRGDGRGSGQGRSLRSSSAREQEVAA